MSEHRRAQDLLSEKRIANAKTYANLPEPTPSRQVQRRSVRVAVARAVSAAKAEVLKNRRKGKS